MNSRKRPHAETKEAGRLQELLVLGFLPQDQGNKKKPFPLIQIEGWFSLLHNQEQNSQTK